MGGAIITTDKINHSPDYESEAALPVTKMHAYTDEEAKSVFAKFEHEQERTRLEREVIEAAKRWNGTNYRLFDECEVALSALGDACDALIEFEAKQK